MGIEQVQTFLVDIVVEFINLFRAIFLGLIQAIPFLINFILQLLSLVMSNMGDILSLIMFCITHFYLFIFIFETIVLGLAVTQKGFVDRLAFVFNTHMMLIKVFLYLPQYLTTLISNISGLITITLDAAKAIWESIKDITSWLVTAASGVGAGFGGIAVAAIIIIIVLAIIAITVL